MIKYSAYTGKGIKKNSNDDRIFVDNHVLEKDSCSGKKERTLISIVCDGVGSSVYGGQTAEMITESFRELEADKLSPAVLVQHLNQINKNIVNEQTRRNNGFSMASTIAGLIICGNDYLAFNLGDTHIYRFILGNLSLVSFDHTVKNENNFFFCSNSSNKNALTRYMGGDGMTCYPFFKRGSIGENSIFLLCSDGVYKHISDNDIRNVLTSDISLAEKTDKLVQLAIESGSTDDVSVVLINCYNNELESLAG